MHLNSGATVQKNWRLNGLTESSNTEALRHYSEYMNKNCAYTEISRNWKWLNFAGHVLYEDPAEKRTTAWKVKWMLIFKWHKKDKKCGLMMTSIKMWTNMDSYEIIKRIAQDRQTWRTYSTSCRPSTLEMAKDDSSIRGGLGQEDRNARKKTVL